MAGRVCHLSYEYPPHIYGGLGRHVFELTTAQERAGWNVAVATVGHPAAPAPSSGGRVAVHPVGGVPVIGDGSDWTKAVTAFDHALLDVADPLVRAADVVHAHDWFAVNTAITLSKRHRRPLVVTVHATERGRHQGWLPDALNRFVDAQEQRLAAAADAVIVCSAWMRGALADWWGLAAHTITVIPNGVGPAAPAAAIGTGRSGVLFAGRCEHEKGGQVLLAAVAKLRADGLVPAVTVAGEGSQREAWRVLAADLGIAEQVTFAGRLDDAALSAAYRQAAVVVVPSLYEPFGLVATEAMAAGAPVVAAATGGLAETVASGGLLVPPSDPAALAAALASLLRDECHVTAASERALQRAAQLPTWDEVANWTVSVYDRTAGPERS